MITSNSKFKRICLKTKYKCFYCNIDLLNKLHTHEAHLDHQLPKSKGGKDNEDNLVLSCRKCNLSKGNMTCRAFKLMNEIKSSDEYKTFLIQKETYDGLFKDIRNDEDYLFND